MRGAVGFDSAFWGLEEIVSNILQWLPPAALVNARLVCTSWNKIVLSQRSQITKSCCYLFCPRTVEYRQINEDASRFFDPTLCTWMRVSCPKPSASNVPLALMGSGGNSGLVAFQEVDGRYLDKPPPDQFWVGNPLTNRWKFIPGVQGLLYDKLCRPSYHFVATESTPVTYKIIAIGSGSTSTGRGIITFVYDSTTGEWNRGASYFLRDGFGLWLSGSGTHNGCIYFLSDYYRMRRIVRYSVEHDRFDVIAQATGEDLKPLGFLFLKGKELPVIAASRKGNVHFYEIQQDAQAWTFNESWQLDSLKAVEDLVTSGEGKRRAVENLVISGEAELMYVDGAFNTVAMYEVDKQACRALPQPFLSEDEGRKSGWSFWWEGLRVCTFRPRYDIQP